MPFFKRKNCFKSKLNMQNSPMLKLSAETLKGLYNSFKMETQQSVARDAGCSQSAVSKT